MSVKLLSRGKGASRWCICWIVVSGDPYTVNPNFELLHEFNDLSEDQIDLVTPRAALFESSHNTDFVVRTEANTNASEA